MSTNILIAERATMVGGGPDLKPGVELNTVWKAVVPAPEPSSGAFLGTLVGLWVSSGVARSQTGIQMG